MNTLLSFLAPIEEEPSTAVACTAAKRLPSVVSVANVRATLLSAVSDQTNDLDPDLDPDLDLDQAGFPSQFNEDYRPVCALDSGALDLVSAVIAFAYSASASEGVPLSPFKATAEKLVTSPRDFIGHLKANGYKVMRGHGSTEMINPSYSSISAVTGIAKGTLASIDSGRMNFNSDTLEQWRTTVANIGRMNDDEDLKRFDDPRVFFTELVKNIAELNSQLKLCVVEDWARKYSGGSEEEITEELKQAVPNYAEYYGAIIQVWRTEILEGKVANLTAGNFLSLLKHYTSSTKLMRGFHRLITAVHINMPKFNSAVTYSSTNYSEYRLRYSHNDKETGVTADIAMAYCFFLGMNPITLLSWLATNEHTTPGSYEITTNALEENDLIHWKGPMSPMEYKKLVGLVSDLNIVSDQDRWSMARFDYRYVYDKLPTYDVLMHKVGSYMPLLPLIAEVGGQIEEPRVTSAYGLFDLITSNNLLVNLSPVVKSNFKYAVANGMDTPLWSSAWGYAKVREDIVAADTDEDKLAIFDTYLNRITTGAQFPMMLEGTSYESAKGTPFNPLCADLIYHGIAVRAGREVEIS